MSDCERLISTPHKPKLYLNFQFSNLPPHPTQRKWEVEEEVGYSAVHTSATWRITRRTRFQRLHPEIASRTTLNGLEYDDEDENSLKTGPVPNLTLTYVEVRA